MKTLLALCAVWLIGSCTTTSAGTASLSVDDLDGMSHRPLQAGDRAASVLVFVTVDCPIANSYAPEIAAIVSEHSGDPLDFYIVHVDPDVTPEIARQHAVDYGLPSPILLDRDHELVRRAGVTITPEAVVIDRDGEIAYRGRIDNWYGDIGRKRPQPTRRELRAAIGDVLAGRPVAVPRTEAVGCDVPVW